MKKLLGLLAVAPLALTACGDAAKAPESITVPMPTDAKQKVVLEFENAIRGLSSTDLTAIDEACAKYVDSSFSVSTATGTADCKGYIREGKKQEEALGVESGLKEWTWKDMSGDDTTGWTVPALAKVESKITNQAKFDKYVDDNVAAAGGFFTKESLTKLLTDGFEKSLKFGTLNTYELVKSGETYKIKDIATDLQSA